jgi:hypothetical protein
MALSMKTPLFSALLALCFLVADMPGVIGAEVPKAPVAAVPAQSVAIEAIASLADPEKLATLGERGANPRVQKITYWLFVVRRNGGQLEAAIDQAFARFGWKGTPQGEETKRTILLNFKRAENLGCFDAAGLEDMRSGKSPTVKRGQFIGQKMSVDHVLPRALVPELDNMLANLELMPLGMNMGKSATVAERERIIARRFVAAGLISPEVVPWAAPFGEKPTAPPPAPTATPRTTPAQPSKNAEPRTPAAAAPSETYVASVNSAVFHREGCKSASKISAKNLVTYKTREEAVKAGKRPCAECKP